MPTSPAKQLAPDGTCIIPEGGKFIDYLVKFELFARKHWIPYIQFPDDFPNQSVELEGPASYLLPPEMH